MSYSLTHWSLRDLFSGYDGPDLAAAFGQIQEEVAAFAAVRDKLGPGIEMGAFLDILRAAERIKRAIDKPFAFAALSFAANTQDQGAQALQARMEQLQAETENATLFFSLWWKGLDASNAQRLMDASGDYRYYLEQIRHFKPHTLTEPEEKIVNLKNVTGAAALRTLYESVTSRYVFRLEVEGKVRELTRGELLPFIQGSNPELRARAYQEMFRVFAADGPILGQIYQALVRDWRNENLALRKYASPIAARNLANDIPDEAVDTLLGVARQNAGIFQRYFKLKARFLGMQKLRRYDVYAPATASDRKIEFESGVQMVMDAYAAFDPRIADLARRVLDQDHLDSEIRKGKQSGAFCADVTPEMTPYVLMSYQGRADDVLTLAHELGHAVHAMLAADHTAFTFSSSLPLAETASTFGEMMLLDKLLSSETDQGVRRGLLFKQLDGAWATITRQAYLAEFERKAHGMIEQNASVDDLCSAYLDNLKQQFGDAVELSDEFKWEWVAVPHIYEYPFYVYAYSFGLLLVLSLYRQFKVEGESFKPKYLKILSAGGSQSPARILSDAGIDIRSADFWQGGFDVLARLVDDLEK